MSENAQQLEGYLQESPISQDRLKELLTYDSVTGIFYRKDGKVAGSVNKDYIRIFVCDRSYYAHQLAWLYVYGEWQKIDHKDRVKSHNWISNLRPATEQENARNQTVRRTNLLGIKGVQRHGNGFRAYITVNYKTQSLGTFATIDEAIAARVKAEEAFGDFNAK